MNSRAIDLHRAQERLPELVSQANGGGEEIVLTEAGEPVAKIVPLRRTGRRRAPGSARGRIIIADDFDAPLDDFREYV